MMRLKTKYTEEETKDSTCYDDLRLKSAQKELEEVVSEMQSIRQEMRKYTQPRE